MRRLAMVVAILAMVGGCVEDGECPTGRGDLLAGYSCHGDEECESGLMCWQYMDGDGVCLAPCEYPGQPCGGGVVCEADGRETSVDPGTRERRPGALGCGVDNGKPIQGGIVCKYE